MKWALVALLAAALLMALGKEDGASTTIELDGGPDDVKRTAQMLRSRFEGMHSRATLVA